MSCHFVGIQGRDSLYAKILIGIMVKCLLFLPFSGILQTVDGVDNPEYYSIIKAFEDLTGDGIIINTSFNVRGEPIVCTPEDAYRCFMRTEMDYLVINNYVFKKTEQPKWMQKDEWREEFALD